MAWTGRRLRQRALKAGYRSGLEEDVACQLKTLGVDAEYEKHVIAYEQPAKARRYTPDFVLPNGIIIETKGRFTADDRMKHLWIKKQHPDLDIRFVFSNSRQRINPSSKTTYAAWCEANGFLYADKLIPLEWIMEENK